MADWKAGLVAPLFHPTKIWNLHLKTGDRNGSLVKLYGEYTCVRVRSADTVLMSQTKGSQTYGEFVNSSTASGSSTTMQARQTRPRS